MRNVVRRVHRCHIHQEHLCDLTRDGRRDTVQCMRAVLSSIISSSYGARPFHNLIKLPQEPSRTCSGAIGLVVASRSGTASILKPSP